MTKLPKNSKTQIVTKPAGNYFCFQIRYICSELVGMSNIYGSSFQILQAVTAQYVFHLGGPICPNGKFFFVFIRAGLHIATMTCGGLQAKEFPESLNKLGHGRNLQHLLFPQTLPDGQFFKVKPPVTSSGLSRWITFQYDALIRHIGVASNNAYSLN